MSVLVTGAARRLGRAMALHLAHRGHDVALHCASSLNEAEELAQDIRALGRQCVVLQADLLDETATEALLPRAIDALGPLSILINNASIFEHDTLFSATRESWDRHIGSNLRAPYLLTQAFARQAQPAQMDEWGEPVAQGLIVNMIDQRIWKPTPEFSTYTIAKMGLWALTQTAAQGLAPHVRVNAIGPGPTLKGARQSEEEFAQQRQSTILRRGANPRDILAALDYLIASPAVTGQMIAVDGGQHLAWKTADVAVGE